MPEQASTPATEGLNTLLQQTVSVAITMLFASYSEDVKRVFSEEELARVLEASRPLCDERVEEFLHRAFLEAFPQDNAPLESEEERKAYSEFQESRTPCADIGQALEDEVLQGVSGYIYCSSYWIAKETGESFRTHIGREEYRGDLETLERTLWVNFVRDELAG